MITRKSTCIFVIRKSFRSDTSILYENSSNFKQELSRQKVYITMSMGQSDFQLFSSLRFDVLLLESSVNSALSTFPSPFYMLPYHRDRMLDAAAHFGWSAATERIRGPEGLRFLLEQLEAVIDIKSSTPLRVRIVLFHDGNITIATSEIKAVPLVNLYPSRIPPPTPSYRISLQTGGAMMLGDGDLLHSEVMDGNPRQTRSWTVVVDSEKTAPSTFTTFKTTCRDMYVDARARAGIESMVEPKEVLIISETSNEIMEGSSTSVLLWRGGRWVTPPLSSGGQAGTTRRWLLEKRLCEEEVISSSSLVNGEECWISNGVRGLMWGKIEL